MKTNTKAHGISKPVNILQHIEKAMGKTIARDQYVQEEGVFDEEGEVDGMDVLV